MIAAGDARAALWRQVRDLPTCTVEQAGALLGLGRRQAYEACRQGQLPAVKVGARWLVCMFRLRALLGDADTAAAGEDNGGTGLTSGPACKAATPNANQRWQPDGTSTL